MSHPGMESLDMLDPANSMTTLTPMSESTGGGPGHHAGIHGPSVYGGMNGMMSHHHHHSNLGGGGGSVPHPAHHHPAMAAAAAAAAAAGLHPDADTDPRELEAFAERFKQRRIKLGVTQADVGKALANLKLPGVGALSQSTICRFESLTLSHNNMIALKPILQAWLEEAEAQAKNKRRDPDAPSVLPAGEKKRKRTSIAAPEKRSLEAYFAVQPRPSGEKIAAIAEKLDLKKNVVRVWFCNQRQKQKRMKFAAQHWPEGGLWQQNWPYQLPSLEPKPEPLTEFQGWPWSARNSGGFPRLRRWTSRWGDSESSDERHRDIYLRQSFAAAKTNGSILRVDVLRYTRLSQAEDESLVITARV